MFEMLLFIKFHQSMNLNNKLLMNKINWISQKSNFLQMDFIKFFLFDMF